jgi:hypothetical protein
MGANSSIRAFNENFLTRIRSESGLYEDPLFWKGLFETLSPFVQIPDLSQVLMSQPMNLIHVCQLSTEFLEVAWLQVEELGEGLIRSCENSLNFLSSVVPVTVELNRLEFFWDCNMRAYRSLKACIGLFSSHFFGSSASQTMTMNQFTTHTIVENSQICNKRREMIGKVLVSCLMGGNYAFKVLLTRDILISEEFLVALIETLTQKSPELVSTTCKVLSLMLSQDLETQACSEDVNFVKDLLKQRKKGQINIVFQFFKSLSDENINKVLYCVLLASHRLEGSEQIETVLDLISKLFTVSSLYCKYIALNKNISIASTILSSREYLHPRETCKSFSSVFYALSLFREFTVSLTTAEVNYLLEILFKLVLAGQYEHQEHFPSILATFCNVSAFVIRISQENSQLITLVFEYLTEKSWLLSRKMNHLNVFYVIQGINNLIQYQWEGCNYLVYFLVKKKESFYKIIRMQVDTPDEVYLDDQATDGELEAESMSEEENHSDQSSLSNHSEKSQSEEVKDESDSSCDEVFSERNDRVIELEQINEGLILGLNAHGPDELVQRTSYLNTHVSTEDLDRRNTVQHIEIKEEEWKPTPEWMLVWKTRLPMKCIFVTIKETFSLIVDLQDQGKKLEEITEELKNLTLVGVLPRPHPICQVQLV